ncbi:uroporphyrinogen decarboxylase/cobalamine-independent methonine synthase family protein [Salininema proteolyticum]|uniref:Methionine synthase n=1 Tax=Salininema proteolyticum TaxID=1607685 RepID=A0ABV8TV98_9ACTN
MSEIPTGTSTGIGSLPGTDPFEASRLVLGELGWPHVPELPARGVGADMIGRGAAILVDLPVQRWGSDWEIADRPGLDLQRAIDYLERDIDAFGEVGDGYTGPVRLTATGPWTLAANVWRRRGGAMLADEGAAADLAQSLAEGLKRLIGKLRDRVPGGRWSLQLDEPRLPAVLAGRVRTESEFGFYRPVERDTVTRQLRDLIATVDVDTVIHCCAPEFDLSLATDAGAVAAVDLTLPEFRTPRGYDRLGEYLDDGRTLVAGVVGDYSGPPDERTAAVLRNLHDLWNVLGFGEERLHRQLILSPACGLAGNTPAEAAAKLTTATAAASELEARAR